MCRFTQICIYIYAGAEGHGAVGPAGVLLRPVQLGTLAFLGVVQLYNIQYNANFVCPGSSLNLSVADIFRKL